MSKAYKIGQKIKGRTILKVTANKIAWKSKDNSGVCTLETFNRFASGR